MNDRILKCPRCKCKKLEVNEIWEGHSISWFQTENGLTTKDGYMNPGDPYKVQAGCTGCGHIWTVRGATQITDIYPSLIDDQTEATR